MEEEGSSESDYQSSEEEEEVDLEAQNETEEPKEEEPILKYIRVNAEFFEILSGDHCTRLFVHSKFLVLGTKDGKIFLLDFDGNLNKTWNSLHHSAINDISVDDAGDNFASCSEEGKLIITGVFVDSEDKIQITLRTPILSVVIDPTGQRGFIYGTSTGELIHQKKGRLFGNRSTILHQGEGPIFTAKWKGNYIAWANDHSVRILDIEENVCFGVVKRPSENLNETFRCSICWEVGDILLVGWGNYIKICHIKARMNATAGLAGHYVDVVSTIQTDYLVTGVAPFGKYIVSLAYIKGREAKKPEVHIISRKNQEISTDVLSLNGYSHYNSSQYRLEYSEFVSSYYIVSPKEIISARARNMDDHISWLLQNKMYELALTEASSNELIIRNHNLLEIGERYINYLIYKQKYEKAAAVLTRILGDDEALWEKWFFYFAKLKQIRVIGPYIGAFPQLSPIVYELVLNYYLHKNPQGFLRKLEEWPCNLYNIDYIIAAVVERNRTNESGILLESLALLHSYNKEYEKTLSIYLKLGRGNVFELIDKYDLYDKIQDKALELMEFDKDEAVKILTTYIEKISIDTVVKQLQKKPYYLYCYLHANFLRDPGFSPEYHEELLRLYADYDKAFLATFLRQSNNYSNEKALKLFKDRNYHQETVFILGRMGRNKEAVELIVGTLQDVKIALEFVREQNDDKLWDSLIELGMKSPNFVAGLVDHIGPQVDPLKIFQRIDNIPVPNLQSKIVQLFSDIHLQMSLRDGCNQILKTDCVSLSSRLHRAKNVPITISSKNVCATCNNPVLLSSDTVILFYCSHAYHQKCLRKEADVLEYSPDKKFPNLRCGICKRDLQSSRQGRNPIVASK